VIKNEQIVDMLEEAHVAAHTAAQDYLDKHFDGQDGGACGFASCNFVQYNGDTINGRTKVGRALKKAGVTQNWNRQFHLWNPAQIGCQSLDALSAGARAAAKVCEQYGFKMSVSSRLD